MEAGSVRLMPLTPHPKNISTARGLIARAHPLKSQPSEQAQSRSKNPNKQATPWSIAGAKRPSRLRGTTNVTNGRAEKNHTGQSKTTRSRNGLNRAWEASQSWWEVIIRSYPPTATTHPALSGRYPALSERAGSTLPSKIGYLIAYLASWCYLASYLQLS